MLLVFNSIHKYTHRNIAQYFPPFFTPIFSLKYTPFHISQTHLLHTSCTRFSIYDFYFFDELFVC